MELDENDGFDQQPEGYVEIYSRNAVLWFSILADPLIGGILLIINLWVAGYKRAIAPVVLFLVAYEGIATAFEYWFTNNFKLSQQVLTQNDLLFLVITKALQILGGLVLAQYFYKKYFPDNDYYPRSILQPLLLTILLIFAMQYVGISF